MASLFEQASLAKRASDEQLVNILSNRMPSVDISQAVAMAELTSRKNMRNAAANQEMIQQGIGAVPVKDQVIAETIQSQNPQMVNPNLVAMSSPEMGNVPRSEAMDMSAPGSIPGAAAGGIVSSYKEPEGRETRGIPAAVRMFEGGRVAFQSGPGPNTVGAYADIVNRIKELDSLILKNSRNLPLIAELKSEKQNLEKLAKTQQDTTDPFYISPDSPYVQEAAMERGEEPPVVEPPVMSDEAVRDAIGSEIIGGERRLLDPPKTELLTKPKVEGGEDTGGGDTGGGDTGGGDTGRKDDNQLSAPEEMGPPLPTTEDIVRGQVAGSRQRIIDQFGNLETALKEGKANVQSAIDKIGTRTEEEIKKMEEFNKPYQEYMATLNKRLKSKEGQVLGKSLVYGGLAMASSNKPFFSAFIKGLGVGVETAEKLTSDIDDLRDTKAKLDIAKAQADEAKLTGNMRLRDQAQLEGAKLNADFGTKIAATATDLTKTLASFDADQLKQLQAVQIEERRLNAMKEKAKADSSWQAHSLYIKENNKFLRDKIKSQQEADALVFNSLKEYFAGPNANFYRKMAEGQGKEALENFNELERTFKALEKQIRERGTGGQSTNPFNSMEDFYKSATITQQ